jgi:hypothetical protein
MGIGRISSVDRKRPAVPRKLANPAEMGFSGRSSVHRRRPTMPKKDCKTCRDGQRQEIFCGQKKTCGPKKACKTVQRWVSVGDLLWTRRRPASSGSHWTERKGAKMNLEGDLLRTEEDSLLQDCTRPLRDPERPCRDSSFPAVFTHEGVFWGFNEARQACTSSPTAARVGVLRQCG